MSDNFKPKLSASTIYMMLLEAKIEGVSRSERFDGQVNPTSDVGLLFSLLKVLWPQTTKMSDSAMSGASTTLKTGKGGNSSFTELHDAAHRASGVERFNSKPNGCLIKCKELFDNCITKDEIKIAILGKRLLEIVHLDDSIHDDTVLRVLPNCNPIKKSDLKDNMSFKIEPLLLGLWVYVIENNIIKDEANAAFERWYGPEDSSHVRHFANTFYGTHFTNCSITSLSNLDRTLETDEDNEPISNVSAPLYDFDTYIRNLKAKKTSIKSFQYKEGERPFNEYYVINDLRFSSNYSYLRGVEVTAENIGLRFTRYAIIAGNGGQGKTMMMNHLLLKAIDDYPKTGVVPVFVCLNEIKEGAPYIDDLIYKIIVEFETLEGVALHINKEREFYPLLLSGKFLFLFDGLDEVEKDKRIDFENQLNKFTDRYSSNQFIISSRNRQDNSFHTLGKYRAATVEPLTKPQAIELIEKLDNIADVDYVKKFREKLDENLYDKHTDFASNPLLLTIMLKTYSTVGEIKDNPYQFYTDAYLALSREHDAKKNWEREFHTGATGDRLGEYLQEICMRSLLDGKRRLTRTEFEDYFRKARDVIGKESENFDFDEFINDLMDSLCIVAMEGSDYVFVHNAFQDYFCTRCLENLDPKELQPLADFYDEDDVLHNTGVLKMLLDRKQNNFEKYVIIPYLKTLFDKCSGPDGFITYIKEVFPIIKIAEGRIDDNDYTMVPSKPFYDFIVNEAARIYPTRQIDVYGCYNEIVVETYGYKLNGNNFESWVPLSESDDLTNPTGHLMIIEANKLFSEPVKYREIIDAITDEDSYILAEYNELKDYFKDVKERTDLISEKRSTLFSRKK